jgi:hypothetical protein
MKYPTSKGEKKSSKRKQDPNSSDEEEDRGVKQYEIE